MSVTFEKYTDISTIYQCAVSGRLRGGMLSHLADKLLPRDLRNVFDMGIYFGWICGLERGIEAALPPPTCTMMIYFISLTILKAILLLVKILI